MMSCYYKFFANFSLDVCPNLLYKQLKEALNSSLIFFLGVQISEGER